MSEMVERVARAIYAVEPLRHGILETDIPWDRNPEGMKGVYLRQARAAIEAMREPTRAMVNAGAEGSGEDSTYVALGAWEAMVDAALIPSPPEN